MASIDRTYHLPVNDVGSEASQIKEEVGAPVFTLRVATEVVTLFRTHDTVQSAISELSSEYDTIWREMQAEVPTPDWHGTATDLDPLVRTHILRLAKGWRNESAVVRYLEQNDGLTRDYGYDSIEEVEQSKLWRAWNKRFSDELKQVIEDIASTLVDCARENGIPAPDEAFQPSQTTPSNPSKRTERELISKHTKEVWQQAKPFVEDSFYLHRGENTRIPEGAWWEQHTYMGMRSDMYAESGADSYRDDTTRELTPRGRHHRDKLQMLKVEETRQMLQNATKALVTRARHNSELVGELTVAIDITKGHPWTGEVERSDAGRLDEDYILGYKGGERHFQWASIQVVGHDIPLVLDVIPVHRGFSRDAIVDELLRNAKEIVGGIELVMMDREFDSDSVKQVCEDHDVFYLNPKRKYSSERAMCTRLRQRGEIVHIETQNTFGSSDRKRMYLPSTAVDAEPAVEDTGLVDSESGGSEPERNVRQELLEEFESIGGDVEGLDRDETSFDDVMDDIREEETEEPTIGSAEDEQAYAIFETNHPLVEVSDDDTQAEQIHMVERMVRRYSHRWGIENGFKKIKKFMVRTTSKDHTYRFFNFAFACVLYNVWRLVDLLVKLAIDGENGSYSPKIDANRFLTHAKKYYGIPPPE